MSNHSLVPFFSIITPCYNVERYLTHCVDSILHQPFSNWELLLIDDGSTDSTPDICEQLAKGDLRIKAIHQENAGVSAARNRGLDEAKGEWVLFIDSDDWFTEDAFAIYAKSINNYTADRYIFNRYSYKDGKINQPNLKPEVLLREDDQIKYFLIDMLFPYYDFLKNGVVTGGIRGVNCSLYKRKIIENNGIRFERNVKIAEDAMFNFDFISHSKTICMQNLMVGFYRIEQTSVMHRFNPNIDDINQQTISGFKKRIELHINNDFEYRIAYFGMITECMFRGMKLKYVNPINTTPRRQRIKQFKEWYYQEYIQKDMDYGFLKFLPKGKKQIMWCLKHKMVGLAMWLSVLSIAYLKKKNKI